MPCTRRKQLVKQMLENIRADALESHIHIISHYARHRQGVYVLYHNKNLYYVGLAQNLQRRLQQHLRDRHHDRWNKFSVYLTIDNDFVKEMESLLLRITRPKGNKVRGNLVNCVDLRRAFRRDCKAYALEGVQRLWLEEPRYSAARGRDGTTGCGQPKLARYISKGMPLEASRNGQHYRARVRKNGLIRFKGATFPSPSGAAKAACGGKSVNGWHFWRFARAPGDWVPLKEIRKNR